MSRKKSTNSKVNFGERLKKLRTTKGLKQKEFAELLGITVSYLSQIENGEKGMGLDTLILLSGKFGANINWLLTGEGPMFREDTEGHQDRIKQLERENKILKDMIKKMEESEQKDVAINQIIEAKIRELEAENRNLSAELESLKHIIIDLKSPSK